MKKFVYIYSVSKVNPSHKIAGVTLANAPQLSTATSKYTTEMLGLQKMKLFLYLSFLDSTEQDKVTHMKTFIAQVAYLVKKERITLAE
ncbi:MAG: hypothetical protein AAF900_00590 [Bacteroidota bacterium]